MGVSSGKFGDAGPGFGPGCADDQRPTQTRLRRNRCQRRAARLIALLWLLLFAAPAISEPIRIATFAAPLTRDGPGLLLRDILAGDDPQIAAIIGVIQANAPDILVLTDVDHDDAQVALSAFVAALANAGIAYPHQFSLWPNAGMATGLDLDGNGRLGEARDAMGYGRFAGQGGVAVLSRWPLGGDGSRDFTGLLWRDLPGASLPKREDGRPFPSQQVQDVLRLSSTAHFALPVDTPDGPLTLLVWSATPPLFDGPEDMNGLRARDELRVWQVLLDGGLGDVPAGPFFIAGLSNLDPADGDGDRAAMAWFLADPRWQDPLPASVGGAVMADAGQSGDPALDTVDWPVGTPGNLRVSYVLPSTDLTVTGSGVFWPGADDSEAALLGPDGLAAGPHRLVWVDVDR